MKIPVVLPLVRVTVADDGNLSVRVDGEPYDAVDRLDRTDLSDVLAAITTARATPVRVELREADGTTYADIATPPEPASPERTHATEATPAHHVPADIGFSGHGFQPGEPVALAYLLTQRPAGPDGAATLRLPPAVLTAHRERLVLLGLNSRALVGIEAPA